MEATEWRRERVQLLHKLSAIHQKLWLMPSDSHEGLDRMAADKVLVLSCLLQLSSCWSILFAMHNVIHACALDNLARSATNSLQLFGRPGHQRYYALQLTRQASMAALAAESLQSKDAVQILNGAASLSQRWLTP